MAKEVMDRRASDNEYLHRDFHGALSSALIYLEERFGPEAVSEYLRGFARAYYAPLSAELRTRGLEALADRLRRVYETEGAELSLTFTGGSLTVEVEACPAVRHMRERGYAVSPLWRETIRAVNEAICEGSVYAFELLEYREETGASRGRFFRREEGDRR
jgi:hypothetical protein